MFSIYSHMPVGVGLISVQVNVSSPNFYKLPIQL